MDIRFPAEEIEAFCRRWKVAELSVFGSARRGGMSPDSDVDLLIEFNEDASWSLFDWVDMIAELKAILGREVDLVSKQGLRNPYRRQAILAEAEILYAA
ncbi:MAG: nucleotidyltransferase family protein [Desulfarculus sp.]|nr:nucleotidyltransferase family protein [Desulfarculus sp.]